MRPVSYASILTLGILAAVGCSAQSTDDSGSSNDDLNATNAAADLTLARKAVGLIAGPTGKCTNCHTASRDDIRRWADTLRTVEARCLAPTLSLTAAERIACLQQESNDAPAGFSATKLGLYSAGATLAQFEDLFKAAYPAETYAARFAEFKRAAGMPAFGGTPFSAADFETVKSWAQAGAPNLDDVLAEPGAFPCTESSTPELAAHMGTMKNEGWGARLASASTPMARCGTATDAKDCLTDLPDITPTWGPPGTSQKLRELRKLDFRTSYWVRSSPDGRYAAFGGSSRIIDLNAGPSAPYVTIKAPYDPGFFPNNDGFSYAGTQAGGLRVCRTSVLLNAFASTDKTVTFGEAGCSKIIDTVYQSVGAALDGSLFFMATGAHTNDAGGNTGPLSAAFGENATTTLTPMYNDGTKYAPGAVVQVKIPFEGDQQMSPSNQLLITRFGQRAGTAGYRIRKVTPTVVASSTDAGASSSLQVTTKLLGTVCLAGGKPQLSFDERFLAVHQYVDSNANPDGLPTNSSNIFIADLKTGAKIQVTKMGPGQRALYPHWRADGWLYFLVRDSVSGKETLVASDAALNQP